MVAVHRAEQKHAQALLAAEEQKLARVRQLRDGILHGSEMAVEPGLQLRQGHVRCVTLVEFGEGQAKLGAELIEGQFRNAGLAEDEVGGPPDGWQVIDQSPRPIKNDVANHFFILRQI